MTSSNPLDGGLPDLNAALASFEEQQKKLADFQRKINETSTVVDAPKKLFTVTLDGNGELTNLKFNTTGYRSMAPAELSSLLTETLQKARQESMQKMQEMMDGPIGGVDMNELASGQADLGEVLGKIMQPSVDFVQSRTDGAESAQQQSSTQQSDEDEDDGWAR